MIPILGIRIDRWHVIANPGIACPLTGAEKRVNFEPAYKASYRTSTSGSFGVEYYEEAGPLRKLLPGDERYRVLATPLARVPMDGTVSARAILEAHV